MGCGFKKQWIMYMQAYLCAIKGLALPSYWRNNNQQTIRALLLMYRIRGGTIQTLDDITVMPQCKYTQCFPNYCISSNCERVM